jgi:hypothetical protein
MNTIMTDDHLKTLAQVRAEIDERHVLMEAKAAEPIEGEYEFEFHYKLNLPPPY